MKLGEEVAPEIEAFEESEAPAKQPKLEDIDFGGDEEFVPPGADIVDEDFSEDIPDGFEEDDSLVDEFDDSEFSPDDISEDD